MNETSLSFIKKYYYTAFGLNISSEFFFEEMMPGEGPAEIEIVKGKVRNASFHPPEQSDFAVITDKDLFFQAEDAGRFQVSDGKRIVVEPFKDASPSIVKLYILGSAIGILLIQRGILAIHGSSVAIGDGCVIFTGMSGAGKSTISSALRKKGFSMLTDDIAALMFRENGDIFVQPGYPHHKLCMDSAEMFVENRDALTHVIPEINKCIVRVHDRFHSKPCKLTAMIEIRQDESDKVAIKEIEGVHKLAVLVDHTYRAGLIPFIGTGKDHLSQCASVVRKIPIFRLTRPKNSFSADEQVKLVLETLGNLI